jgi:hypothetical protein
MPVNPITGKEAALMTNAMRQELVSHLPVAAPARVSRSRELVDGAHEVEGAIGELRNVLLMCGLGGEVPCNPAPAKDCEPPIAALVSGLPDVLRQYANEVRALAQMIRDGLL